MDDRAQRLLDCVLDVAQITGSLDRNWYSVCIRDAASDSYETYVGKTHGPQRLMQPKCMVRSLKGHDKSVNVISPFPFASFSRRCIDKFNGFLQFFKKNQRRRGKNTSGESRPNKITDGERNIRGGTSLVCCACTILHLPR